MRWLDALMQFQFASPWFLALAPVVLLALALGLHRRLPTLLIPSLAGPARAAPTAGLASGLRLPLWFEAAGLLCLCVALARPRFGVEQTVRRAEGIDMILAIDISGSMDSYDFPDAASLSTREIIARIESGQAKPRVEVARAAVQRFIARRPDDRLGLIAFATNHYTICPPTLDHDFLLGNLAQLTTNILDPRNTGLAAPIAAATARLKDSTARRRVLVLFTDGRNTVDDKLTPLQATKLAAEFNVIIYTVGIGSEYAYQVEPRLGRLLPSRGDFDRELLEQMAKDTGGEFFMAEDAAGLDAAMRRIDALEKVKFDQPRYIEYREQFAAWLLAGLLLLLLGVAAEHTVCLKTP